MRTHTKEYQDNSTPAIALQTLMDGNRRFVQNVKAQRDLQAQMIQTKEGQYPFAVILSCIDSRVPTELVFDQGIGDVFSIRIAGNVINQDILGSMEFACKVAGSKIIVIMGHTQCGAIKAACTHVELGNLTPLLNKINPAINVVRKNSAPMTEDQIEEVARLNVSMSIEQVLEQSPILRTMKEMDEIEIVGAVYSVSTGKVDFFHNDIASFSPMDIAI